MTKQPYPEELKIEAVKQITERGHRVADVSARISVSQHGLYKWIKAYAVPAPERQMQTSQTFLRDHNLVSSMSRRGNCHTTLWPRASSNCSGVNACSTTHSAVIRRWQDYPL